MKKLLTGKLPPSAGEEKCRKRGKASRKYDGKKPKESEQG
jgi:hypothetical protein